MAEGCSDQDILLIAHNLVPESFLRTPSKGSEEEFHYKIMSSHSEHLISAAITTQPPGTLPKIHKF